MVNCPHSHTKQRPAAILLREAFQPFAAIAHANARFCELHVFSLQFLQIESKGIKSVAGLYIGNVPSLMFPHLVYDKTDHETFNSFKARNGHG